MNTNEIIRTVMETKGVKPSVLAARLGIKNNVLSERLSQKNISINKLNEMLGELEYKVLIVPLDAKVPTGGFEVENCSIKDKRPASDLDG